MTSETIIGLLYVLASAILQGTFLLPMDYIRRWRWERSWLAFSFFGMIAFNWLFAFAGIPQLLRLYASVAVDDLSRLALFGFGWGLGAVLFGIGMARLGLSLGYPIIMGLIASLGALIPLVIFFPGMLISVKGFAVVGGTLIVLVGILLCSQAATHKNDATRTGKSGLSSGVMIALAAGTLSCLPNIGMTFAQNIVTSARAHGADATAAGNAVWAIFFTAGFAVNAMYCLYLMYRDDRPPESYGAPLLRNLALSALMGLLWIGSFYGYGLGAERMGALGPVVGWPLFIATSIAVGNVVGLWRGEWKEAPATARVLLNRGMVVLLSAMLLIAASGSIR